MKVTKETEQRLYNALKEWAQLTDSTPSEPEQGVVLTYQFSDGVLSFWVDYTEDDFNGLHFGSLYEDIVEAEELLGYDKIASRLLNEVKANKNYEENNVDSFVGRLKFDF